MRTRLLAWCLLVLLVAATAGPSSAADVPVAGSVMQLADAPQPAGRRNLVAILDRNVNLASVDPRVTGATVRLGTEAGGVAVLDLPAAGWTMVGNAPRIDYKYRGRTGPVRGARLLNGRSIRFTARGEGAYALAGVVQGQVDVAIDFGSVRFCSAFGGTIARDDGQRFVAHDAPAPARCPGVGGTTSTSMSSTTTTTTTTSSSTTTTTLPVLLCECWAGQSAPQVVAALGGVPTASQPPYCTIEWYGASVAGAVTKLGTVSEDFLTATGNGAGSAACVFTTSDASFFDALVRIPSSEFPLCLSEVQQIASLAGWCEGAPPPQSIGVCPTDGTAQACGGFRTSSNCMACAGGIDNGVCMVAASGDPGCANSAANAQCAASINSATTAGIGGCATLCGCPQVVGGDACSGVTCPAGSTCCGGTCKVTSSDGQNCGFCGNACPTDNACVSGICVPQLAGCPSLGTAEACTAYREGGIADCRSCVLNLPVGTPCSLGGDPHFPYFDFACTMAPLNALCASDINRLGCASVCCPAAP